MGPEATFVVLYAAALLAGAGGLHRLGRARRPQRTDRSQDGRPAARNERPTTSDRNPCWPHSEVPRFYTGMALVAAGASTLLSAGELLGRAHRSDETALLVTVIVLGLITIGWLGANLR